MNMVAMKPALVLEVQNLIVSPMAAAVLTCTDIQNAVVKHEHGDFVRDKNQRFKSFFESKLGISFHMVTEANAHTTYLWIDLVGKDVYLSETAWTDENVEMPIGSKCSVLTYNVERQELYVSATKNGRNYCFYVHEYWITPYQSRTVSIPASNEHGGHAWNLVSVTIPWVCPKCGGPRGEVFEGFSYDGSQKLNVDCWKNPCGHIDLYEEVWQEAGLSESNKGSVIFPLPVIFGARERLEKVMFERVNLHKWKQVDTSELLPSANEESVSEDNQTEVPRRRFYYLRLVNWLKLQTKAKRSRASTKGAKKKKNVRLNQSRFRLIDITDITEQLSGTNAKQLEENSGTTMFPFYDLVTVHPIDERKAMTNPQQIEIGAMLCACAATLTDRRIFKR